MSQATNRRSQLMAEVSGVGTLCSKVVRRCPAVFVLARRRQTTDACGTLQCFSGDRGFAVSAALAAQMKDINCA